MNKKPESFEIAEYSQPAVGTGEAYKAVRQITSEITRDVPTHAVWVDMVGNVLRVHYHSYEMFLPQRLKEVESTANDSIKEFVSALKKEYKSRMGEALRIKEIPGGDRTTEKVSLNERYYYKLWKLYELSV
jgi:hypothetical protein